MSEPVKHNSDSSTCFNNFNSTTVSSTETEVQQVLMFGVCNEGQVKRILSNNFNHPAKSGKFHETSILRPSRILKEQQQPEFSEKELFREAKENKKSTGVFFRDPIHEVIQSRQGLKTPDCSVYNLGDEVEIADGSYSRKIGRIVKMLGDLVQVEVGNMKPTLLYISPNMLQPIHGRRILA